jgi:hypothetical protein
MLEQSSEQEAPVAQFMQDFESDATQHEPAANKRRLSVIDSQQAIERETRRVGFVRNSVNFSSEPLAQARAARRSMLIDSFDPKAPHGRPSTAHSPSSGTFNARRSHFAESLQAIEVASNQPREMFPTISEEPYVEPLLGSEVPELPHDDGFIRDKEEGLLWYQTLWEQERDILFDNHWYEANG